MAELIVTRPKSINAKARSFKILMNDHEIGQVNNGETKSFGIPSGEHKVLIGFGKKIKTYGDITIESTDQTPVKLEIELAKFSLWGNAILGAGAGLIGMGVSKGGISIIGVILCAIGVTIIAKTTKGMKGKSCKIIKAQD